MGKSRGRAIKGVSFPLRIGNNGGFVMSKDNTHIEESIVQILSTYFRERVMRPDFGTSIDRQIFEPNDVELQALIKYEIVDALSKYETRIVVDEDNIQVSGDSNVLELSISYAMADYTNMGLVETKIKLGGEFNEN